MTKTIELFFDYGSPTAYLAWSQVPKIAARHGTTWIRRPMLLGGVFRATGNRAPGEVPAKGRYLGADLARYARRYGVPLTFNPFFPINTLTLMRGAVAAEDVSKVDAWDAAIFRAMWVEGRNMGTVEEVGRTLAEIGWDADDFLARINSDAVKDRLKATTEEAVARGAFGAPTMFVGDEMFFGQDRLDFVEEALAA
jgi:2-hydroxychromene-2-carboxylate isomerase